MGIVHRLGGSQRAAVTVVYSCSSCGQESKAGTEETCCIDPHRFISRVI